MKIDDLLQILWCPQCRARLDGLNGLRCSRTSASLSDEARCTFWGATRLMNRLAFTSTIDHGFDQRWQKHPKPQATTAGILEQKTGWPLSTLRGKLVLDAGCGCGRFSEVTQNAGAQVIGVDGSRAGVTAAAQLVPSAYFLQADLLQLPIRDRVFDAAFSIGVLHHTADMARAFAEVARTVKIGGELAVWLYVYPGGDGETKVIDPEVAAAAEFLHDITKACPPEAFYAACQKHAVRVRDLYSSKWGPLHQVLRVSNSRDDEECVSDTFDWHCAQYRSGHTNSELRRLFEDTGFEVVWTGSFPVSMRGRKLR